MSQLSDFLDPSKKANRGIQRGINASNAAYSDVAAMQKPYADIGVQGLAALADPSAERFRADPGYAFRLQGGVDAIDRSAAARGSLASGQTLKALTEFGQGTADQTYNDWFNRNMSLTGIGQNAVNNTGNARLGLGQTQAQGYSQIGANKANAGFNTLNMVGSALGKLFS